MLAEQTRIADTTSSTSTTIEINETTVLDAMRAERRRVAVARIYDAAGELVKRGIEEISLGDTYVDASIRRELWPKFRFRQYGVLNEWYLSLAGDHESESDDDDAEEQMAEG